jgi:hypothetical protein
MELELPRPLSHHPSWEYMVMQHTKPKNTFASIKTIVVKIAKSYMGTIYNSATILSSN